MENNNDFYIAADGLEYCNNCHAPRQKRISAPIFDGEHIFNVMCKCQYEHYEREEAKRKKREFDDMVARNRNICFHEPRMKEWTFANDDGSNSAMSMAEAYVDAWDDARNAGAGFLFWGGVGTGKTYMAACIANALLDQGKKVLMRDFTEISNISAFDGEEYVKSLSAYDLLILDDLGAERKSEFAMQNVFNVINRRWESGKPLIVTTNLSIKEMKDLASNGNIQYQRIYDRIFDACTPICVNGASKRQQSAERKKGFFTKLFNRKGDEPNE